MTRPGARGVKLAVAPLLAALAVSACTARQGYEGLRAGARNDCALQPASEYERCLQRLDMDYETYRDLPPPPGHAGTAPTTEADVTADDAADATGRDGGHPPPSRG